MSSIRVAGSEEESRKERIRWAAWEREQLEAEARDREWSAYWDRRRKDDDDLWRDKDFANAVDKSSRAGYQGKHGNFTVPHADKLQLEALYMQVTVGDYDGNHRLECADVWKGHRGKSRVEAQREYIKATNRMLSRFGWNPPEGWN